MHAPQIPAAGAGTLPIAAPDVARRIEARERIVRATAALAIALVPLAAVGWIDAVLQPSVPFTVLYAIPVAAFAWLHGGRPGWLLVLAATLLAARHALRLEAVHGSALLTAAHVAGELALFAAAYGAIDRLRAQIGKLHAARDLYGRLAFRDRLTDLPNRQLLYDRLATAMAAARRNEGKVALLFLDLDGFKPVNDHHGHKAGDRVLKAVATRLAHAVRETDTVARVGGDEFAVLLADVHGAAAIDAVARKLLDAVAEPIPLEGGATAHLGASIGVGVFPDNAMEIDRLVAVADSAMYASKARGKNCCTYSDVREDEGTAAAWLVFKVANEIGITEIDRQHRNLVEMANRLNAAIRAGEAADHVSHLFAELLLYTRFHFATEERFMARYDYPARQEHETLHAQLVEEISHLREQMLPGNELAGVQAVKDWLLDHIADADRDLGIFLAGKKVR